MDRRISHCRKAVNEKLLWRDNSCGAEVCGSQRLTGAMLDRLTHRVHIVEPSGERQRRRVED